LNAGSPLAFEPKATWRRVDRSKITNNKRDTTTEAKPNKTIRFGLPTSVSSSFPSKRDVTPFGYYRVGAIIVSVSRVGPSGIRVNRCTTGDFRARGIASGGRDVSVRRVLRINESRDSEPPLDWQFEISFPERITNCSGLIENNAVAGLQAK